MKHTNKQSFFSWGRIEQDSSARCFTSYRRENTTNELAQETTVRRRATCSPGFKWQLEASGKPWQDRNKCKPI